MEMEVNALLGLEGKRFSFNNGNINMQLNSDIDINYKACN